MSINLLFISPLHDVLFKKGSVALTQLGTLVVSVTVLQYQSYKQINIALLDNHSYRSLVSVGRVNSETMIIKALYEVQTSPTGTPPSAIPPTLLLAGSRAQ